MAGRPRRRARLARLNTGLKPKGEMRGGKLAYFLVDAGGNQVGSEYADWNAVWAAAQGGTPAPKSKPPTPKPTRPRTKRTQPKQGVPVLDLAGPPESRPVEASPHLWNLEKTFRMFDPRRGSYSHPHSRADDILYVTAKNPEYGYLFGKEGWLLLRLGKTATEAITPGSESSAGVYKGARWWESDKPAIKGPDFPSFSENQIIAGGPEAITYTGPGGITVRGPGDEDDLQKAVTRTGVNPTLLRRWNTLPEKSPADTKGGTTILSGRIPKDGVRYPGKDLVEQLLREPVPPGWVKMSQTYKVRRGDPRAGPGHARHIWPSYFLFFRDIDTGHRLRISLQPGSPYRRRIKGTFSAELWEVDPPTPGIPMAGWSDKIGKFRGNVLDARRVVALFAAAKEKGKE